MEMVGHLNEAFDLRLAGDSNTDDDTRPWPSSSSTT
jgi:hypothetical protein